MNRLSYDDKFDGVLCITENDYHILHLENKVPIYIYTFYNEYIIGGVKFSCKTDMKKSYENVHLIHYMKDSEGDMIDYRIFTKKNETKMLQCSNYKCFETFKIEGVHLEDYRKHDPLSLYFDRWCNELHLRSTFVIADEKLLRIEKGYFAIYEKN